MTRTRVITLLAATILSLTPAVATGQDTSTAILLRRIEALERANAALEQRVLELESRIKSTPSQAVPIPASSSWRELANWRQLRRGMRPEEVRRLLGEPTQISGGAFARWSWPDGLVVFYEDKVYSWTEPDRAR